ncbi:MAG: sodium:proton exchanger [Sulfurimonas sp.]|nr:sodium:proton exchanger [Sulfurimonas sp.]MBU3938139.1 sodium:proton exchanger [bacterium]MBU4025747.1 sodium:proton exchanger [bacterium]MBU4058226.1 sodium:proton exchanger [bacterium]MBU4111050.1 sodium:proton exchanger [bacterium]
MEEIIQKENKKLKYFIEDYWDIFLGVTSVLLAFYFHKNGQGGIATLFAAIGIGSLSLTVAEVAEVLSERLQEPYGSFVLTLSAVIVEIILLYVILLQAVSNPEVIETVKGGIISAVIVDMNVLLGLAVFLGGLRFTEQEHNKETSSAYTTILFVTAAALLVPGLLSEGKHGPDIIEDASIAIAILLMVFYFIILVFQTKTHTHFFKQTARSRIFRLKRKMAKENQETQIQDEDDYVFEKFNILGLIASIFLFIAIIAFGAEVFATDGIMLAKEYGISAGISGLIIAIVAVSPEIVTAIKAAKNDEIQRVVNIAMGASTVSILLTVPILMGLAYASGIRFTLDFNPLEIGALILTIVLAWKTTDEGQTNYFEGMSHLMFFIAFAIVAFYY